MSTRSSCRRRGNTSAGSGLTSTSHTASETTWPTRGVRAFLLKPIVATSNPCIGDLIDIGVDGINPVQTKSSDMQPERLKREFGRDMTFWGGLDTQYILSRGSREQVVDETKRVLEVFSKDGGFVFAPCHNIQSGVPAENILAMYETAMEFNG